MVKYLQSIRKVLFVLMLLMLVLPYLQDVLYLVKLTPLRGALTTNEKSNFSFGKWFSGEYQEKQEQYVNENFGLRNLFIRINNQIAFSLFNKAKANGVIIGKNDYLYEEGYIKAYYGSDYIGTDSINNRIQKLKYIQDTLQKLHKDLIIVFAAGKGSFYPEYFPNDMKSKRSITNLQKHTELAQKYSLNYINFNSYFVKNKQTSKYPLYPKYGIHWSTYGMCIAADSIIHYIEQKRKIDMPSIYWDKIDIDEPRESDYDIADGMNLKCKLKSFKMGYPQIKYESDSLKVKPSVLVISDSFYWGLFNFGITNTFSKSQFWYYNEQIYPESYNSPLNTKDVNLKDEINKYDVIIIMATEVTLPKLGWGFIENTYSLFKTPQYK